MSTHLADASRGWRRVFLRDMLLYASIGVHPHEHRAPQRVLINVDLAVADDPATAIGPDQLDRVLDYEALANRVKAIVMAGHTRLVETLAERLAAACLDDPRVLVARLRVEKLDVLADVGAAGVEIERRRA